MRDLSPKVLVNLDRVRAMWSPTDIPNKSSQVWSAITTLSSLVPWPEHLVGAAVNACPRGADLTINAQQRALVMLTSAFPATLLLAYRPWCTYHITGNLYRIKLQWERKKRRRQRKRKNKKVMDIVLLLL